MRIVTMYIYYLVSTCIVRVGLGKLGMHLLYFFDFVRSHIDMGFKLYMIKWRWPFSLHLSWTAMTAEKWAKFLPNDTH